MKNTIFFRNDDVRDKLDNSLIEITNLFIKYEIPITHAVEPANISKDVAEWLKKIKNKNPQLIFIMQHGYDHTIKNKIKKGEFGGQRNYQEQYDDIKRGKELMDKWFGDLWFPAFNFPYAPYNPAAIKAVNDCRYKVLNSHFNSDISRKVFYMIGHILKKGYLFNHHISWNLNYYPNTNLFEIDMNTSFIKKYYNEEYDCEMLTMRELMHEINKYIKYKTIGVLLHHRYHNTREKIKLVDEYLKWCRTNTNFEFSSIEEIYKKYSNS
jgi:peptidoglycan/xylan/chitin deacetylase (PgdA/CDA1 family)